MKAFEAGWGGAVWKTLGVPVVNVSSRYGSINYRNTKMMGFNNIELITDRPLADNIREIEEVKKYLPDFKYVLFDTQSWNFEDEGNAEFKENVFLMTALALMKSAFNEDMESIEPELELETTDDDI